MICVCIEFYSCKSKNLPVAWHLKRVNVTFKDGSLSKELWNTWIRFDSQKVFDKSSLKVWKKLMSFQRSCQGSGTDWKTKNKSYKQMLSFHNRQYLCSYVKPCASTCDIQHIYQWSRKGCGNEVTVKHCVGDKGQQKQRLIPSEWVLNITAGKK